MPWTSKRHGHECRPPVTKPVFRKIKTGDTWKCFWCGQEWRVKIVDLPNWRYKMMWDKVNE